MSYIDKEKLIKDITDHVSCPLEIMNIINNQEEKEVKSTVHSFWQWHQEQYSSLYGLYPNDCDECGWVCYNCKKYPDHNDYVSDNYDTPPELNRCPNCGAIMDMTEEQMNNLLKENNDDALIEVLEDIFKPIEQDKTNLDVVNSFNIDNMAKFLVRVKESTCQFCNINDDETPFCDGHCEEGIKMWLKDKNVNDILEV